MAGSTPPLTQPGANISLRDSISSLHKGRMKGQDKAPRPSHIAGVGVLERPYRKAIYIVTPQQKKEVLENQALLFCICRGYWTDGLSNRLLLRISETA